MNDFPREKSQSFIFMTRKSALVLDLRDVATNSGYRKSLGLMGLTLHTHMSMLLF